MKRFLVFSLFAIATSSVFALTLKEKKQVKEWNEFLLNKNSSYIGTVKEKCGFDLKVTMEDKFVTTFMEANTSAAAFCDAAMQAISGMCDDETSKIEIVQKIKSLSCHLGKKDESSFALVGTNLKFTYGLGAPNLAEKTKEFLENNL